MASFRQFLIHPLRALWQRLPLPYHLRYRLKSAVFSSTPSFFRGTDAYAAWQEQQKWVESDPGPWLMPLEQYPRQPRPQGLALPKGIADRPTVSVVIPVFNKIDYTVACLDSVALCDSGTPFEVIIVDDGSTDRTRARLSKRSDIRYFRNAKNLGFVGSCNRGAREARGDYVLFLNNDTMVLRGWLDALLRVFSESDDIGLVGSKLIYPDGRLQEAGGIVWRDGSGWNYGRLEDPRAPEFNFVRDVDYCSGASIMVSRAAFMDVGGFDQAFAPAYYEDTSLAFALRARDLRVVYQPESVVVHYEGVTSGTDTSQGVKSFQVRNKELFFDRWRSALAEHGMPGEAPLTLSADRRPRARVLIIDACTPTPDRDSGSEDLWNFIDIFGRLDYRVVFIPASNLLHYGVYTSRLQQQGVECIFYPFAASVQGFLRERGEEFDVVMLMRVDTAADHIGDVRRYCRRAKVVFNTVDLHFLREERRAQLEGAARLLRAGDEEFKTKEIRLMRQSDACVVISEVEASVLAQEAPDVRVHVIPLLRRIPGRTGKGFEGREGIVFIGGFRHPPNVDAMLWFCREVLPDVRRRIPGVELSIIGSDVTSEIEALEGPGVRVLGYVEDIAPLFGRARLSVAPLRYGAGLKGKIATSLGYGVPCVATQIAVEGMGIEGGALSAFIADTADAFAEAIDRCYRDSDLWEQASEAGLRLCRERFAVEANVPRVKALLTDIGLRAD